MTHGERVSHCEKANLDLSVWLSEWQTAYDLHDSEVVDILLTKATIVNIGPTRLERQGNYNSPDWDNTEVRNPGFKVKG